MNATDIIRKANLAGLRLEVRNGNLAIRGIGVRPEELIKAITQYKTEIVGVLRGPTRSFGEESERSEESRSPKPELPPNDLVMADVIPLLGKEDQQVLVNKVIARGRPAVGWCLQRAVAYYEKFPDSLYQDQDAAAALDYLRWLGPGCD